MQDDGGQVASYRVPKIPPFWQDDLKTWFIQIESSFNIASIVSQRTKADYLIQNLGNNVIPYVSDIINQDPPPDNLYSVLKERILASFVTPSEARLRQLLKGQVPGNQRPSHLLTKMRQLSDGQCNTTMMRSIFLEQLPESYKPILAAINEPDLQKLAEIADRIADSFADGGGTVAALAPVKWGTTKVNAGKLDESADLSTVIHCLTDVTNRLTRLEMTVAKQRRGRSSSRKRDNSRSRDQIQSDKQSGLCFIHRKYGDSYHMPQAMFVELATGGKLSKPSRLETIGEGEPRSNRLHVYDRVTGRRFLVDTGAAISVLAASLVQRKTPAELKLFAANNTRIDTYGAQRLTLDLGLRRAISWNFCVAAVPFSIIGADLLHHYGLNVSLSKRRLIDNTTKLHSKDSISLVPDLSISSIDHSNGFAKILLEFPEITGLVQQVPLRSRDVEHHIVTNGPPVAERPRRLPPDKLRTAQLEIKRLMELGICRPSNSPWASPIHLVQKKTGEWRLCGDYRSTVVWMSKKVAKNRKRF